jgi:hypothetical protein
MNKKIFDELRTAFRSGIPLAELRRSTVKILYGLDLPYKCMKDAKLLPNREFALSLIPKGGVVAEVGVAYGDFSRLMLDYLKPSKFYAIDCFMCGPGSDFWGRTEFRDADLYHQEFIERKFAKERNAGVFETIKGNSYEVLSNFPDNSLDYAYLDAAHDYDTVKKDIKVLLSKVKDKGFIQFNDYIIFDCFANIPYGVVRAVDELLITENHELIYFCLNYASHHDVVVKLNK